MTRNAARINFTKKTDEAKEEEDPAAVPAPTSNLAPFENILHKLKDAYTEISVLHDVLAVAKEKHYLVLDPVPQEPSDTKQMALVYARKKALATAASVLNNGADRLKRCDNGPDFQIELLRLRQNWRLKKVSDSIIGDLSFRTAGSKYFVPGNFEVTKGDETTPSNTPGTPGPLQVIIPAELQGIAYIKVVTQKDQEDLCSASVNMFNENAEYPKVKEMYWQKKLEFAQNVLFCKELFAQLAREAVQLQAAIPHVVIGNQIRATLLPGIQLIISFCHTTSYQVFENEAKKKHDGHDHVLEHSLHQLLREVHHKNTHHPLPHSGHAYGIAKKRLLAGPMAFDRHELWEMTKSQTLLEQIIAQAQHIFMRKRTQYVLDTLARDVKDPQIVSHWNALNSPTMSWVKIKINTQGYDTICRTSLVIHVKERSLKAICRDGRVMFLSYEPQELRDLILTQICQHQIAGLQSLAKCMAWQLLSNSTHLGIGAVEPLGNAHSCCISSPNADRTIAVQVRCDPQIVTKVYISHSPKDFYPSSLVQGKFWENLGGNFREVQFEKMEGRNFLNKMEFLMAACTKKHN